MTDQYRVWNSISPDEAWPEHFGHDLRYSEVGRTDYRLMAVIVDPVDGTWYPEEWDISDPLHQDLEETEVWCADCGVLLIFDEPIAQRHHPTHRSNEPRR